MKLLYCKECGNYLESTCGDLIDCYCGWKQPIDIPHPDEEILQKYESLKSDVDNFMNHLLEVLDDETLQIISDKYWNNLYNRPE